MADKNAFWHSLLFTIFIFVSGLFLGLIMENSRVSNIESAFYESEINLIDQQTRVDVISGFNVSCDVAKNELVDFADRIYYEALKLENFDSSSKFANELPLLHKRYDLLRMVLWAESKQFSLKCPQEIHRIVYLYEYSTEDPGMLGLQLFYSRLLGDVKDKYSDSVLLIPIAINTNVSSVHSVLQSYNITKYPAIIIDEEIIFTEPPTLEDFDNYLTS